MKKIMLSITLLILYTTIQSQVTFEKIFSTTGETIANDARQTSDGGYIIAATSNFNYLANGDMLLIKTDAQGDTVWTRMFGGFGAECGNNALETLDGGFLISGYTNTYGAGGTDAYLVKTDANGNFLWSKTIGTVGNDAAYGLVQTADSGFVFSGNELTYGINGYAHLVKTDQFGNVLWSKTYGYNLRKNYVFSLEQTADNGFIMGGYENNYLSTNDEFSMIKTDEFGNMQWYNSYGDLYFDHNFSVCEASDGGFAVAGINFELGGYNYDVNLLKTDIDGNLQWTKKYGGTGHEDVYAVTATSDGGFVFAGSSASFSGYQNGYIAKTDSVGTIIWNKTMNGTGYDIFFSARETSDGGFIFSGVKDEVYGVSGDLYFVKTDANGNTSCNNDVSGYTLTPPTIVGILLSNGTSTPIENYQTPPVTSGLSVSSMCCEAPGGLFVNYITSTQARLNWTPEPGAMQYEVWYKKSGATTWKIKFVPGAKNKLNIKNLKCNKPYEWQIRTVCDTVGADLVSGWSALQTFTTSPCRESELVMEGNISVYPNPASEQFTIVWAMPGEPAIATISVYDMNGKLMYQNLMTTSDGEYSETINSDGYPSGLYMIKIVCDQFNETERLIISK